MNKYYKSHKLKEMRAQLDQFKYPNVHAKGYDTRNYLDLDADECDILINIIEEQLSKIDA